MKLLALLVLLSALASPTVMEVVDDFGQTCPQFFLPNPNNQNERIISTVLTGDKYKQICQIYKNVYRFATLYDTEKKIPVYSAYTIYEKGSTSLSYEKPKKASTKHKWLNEPQLEDLNFNKEMREIRSSEVDNFIHQAVKKDFISPYTRGHLYALMYTSDKDQHDSTCTLTNIAPQTQGSNNKWTVQVETPVLSEIKEKCELSENTPAYIVTGVIPSKNKWIKITRKTEYEKGVNVPEYFWTAFCCTNENNTHVSKAYLAKQDHSKAESKTVTGLNEALSVLYNTPNFKVFGDMCQT